MKKARFKTRCWIWAYGTNGNGYGSLKYDGKWHDAHRFIYELLSADPPLSYGL